MCVISAQLEEGDRQRVSNPSSHGTSTLVRDLSAC